MKNRNERLTALTLIGILALNYPLLSLFADGGLLFGIPVLYLYLFVLWGVFIVLVAVIIETRAEREIDGSRQAPQSTPGDNHHA